MFPLARGVPAVGRTWIPDQVSLDTTVLVSSFLTVTVMVVVFSVAVESTKETVLPLPLNFVIVTVTADPVLNTNPEGAFRMIVPLALMSPVAPSSSTGPVNPVYVPPAVAAEMLALASVLTVAVAKADPAVARRKPSINQNQMSTFF
ncbi:MAG TPA: hypothetical protein VF515_11740 [Candidatus Binatia bacterium]